jgi:hypothetical protein
MAQCILDAWARFLVTLLTRIARYRTYTACHLCLHTSVKSRLTVQRLGAAVEGE